MLEVEGRAAGCLGWRLLEPGLADIYNVMWGVPGYGGQGLMGRALLLMCAQILAQGPWPIMAKVVAGNPALGWYLKNGFVIADRQKGHDEVKLDLDRFAPPAFRRLPA